MLFHWPQRLALVAQSCCSRTSWSSVEGLHTSAVLHASVSRKRTSAKRGREDDKDRQPQQHDLQRAFYVLGSQPGDDSKWLRCDLHKVLIHPEDVASEVTPPSESGSRTEAGQVRLPKYIGLGLSEKDKQMLFEELPAFSSTQSHFHNLQQVHGERWKEKHDHSKLVEREQGEMGKANMLAQLLDLRNANAGGINYENRKRIVLAFSGEDQKFDTGRPEVQAAILTMRIRNLWTHLQKCTRDVGNRRSLRTLIHQRAKVLKYLKGLDRRRYDALLPRLALEPRSVEGELVV